MTSALAPMLTIVYLAGIATPILVVRLLASRYFQKDGGGCVLDILLMALLVIVLFILYLWIGELPPV